VPPPEKCRPGALHPPPRPPSRGPGSNFKALALTRASENQGENQDISLETTFTLSLAGHTDISFSDVLFVISGFSFNFRVNVVSCRVTLQLVKYFFLVKIHSSYSIYIKNSLLAANCRPNDKK